MAITPPALLTPQHDVSSFDCNNEVLSDWLKRQALKNQESGASRTFVITDGNRVIGYFALATGCVERLKAPANVARNMPDPIPVIVLGRLAIDKNFHGQRLGAHLLRESMLRTLRVSEEVGVRALLVHAIDERAKAFYLKYKFVVSVIDPMTLMISVANIRSEL